MLCDRPVEKGICPEGKNHACHCHRRRRLHRQPHLPGTARCGPPGHGDRQPLQQQPGIAATGGGNHRKITGLFRGRSARCGQAARRVPPDTGGDGGDPFRRAQGGGRVGDQAVALLPQQPGRHPQPLPDHGRAGRDQHRLFLLGHRLRRSGLGAHPRGFPAVLHQSLWPHQTDDRGDPARSAQGRCPVERDPPALFQPGRCPCQRPDRRGPQRHPQQSRALYRPGGGGQAAGTLGLRQRLSHPGRHRRARLHPCGRPGARPPACPGKAARPARRGHLQPGHRPGLFGPGDGRRLRPSVRPADSLPHRPPPGRRHRPVLCRPVARPTRAGLAGPTGARHHVRRHLELAGSQPQRLQITFPSCRHAPNYRLCTHPSRTVANP